MWLVLGRESCQTQEVPAKFIYKQRQAQSPGEPRGGPGWPGAEPGGGPWPRGSSCPSYPAGSEAALPPCSQALAPGPCPGRSVPEGRVTSLRPTPSQRAQD